MNGGIDLQINGWIGISFSNPGLTEALARQACAAIRASGTAGFLATIVTNPPEIFDRNIALLAGLDEPGLLGLHLEGPFFLPTYGAIGVHPPQCCLPANVDMLKRWQDLARGRIRLITIGADVPGAAELTAAACRLGIVVSLGHHMATSAQITACADAGATALTHLGNGLPMQIHRHENPIWAGLAEDRLAVMVILDGHHIPPTMARIMARVAGERLILVSDAASIAGMPPGRYQWMEKDLVIEANGRLSDSKTGFFAGSSSSMGQCMDVAQQWGIPDVQAASVARPLALLEKALRLRA